MNEFVFATVAPDVLSDDPRDVEVLLWTVDGWGTADLSDPNVITYSFMEVLLGHAPINPPYTVIGLPTSDIPELVRQTKAHLN